MPDVPRSGTTEAGSSPPPSGSLPMTLLGWGITPTDNTPGCGIPVKNGRAARPSQVWWDTWNFPRVCGTFKERAGWHGCQVPEPLLGRIIRACSDPGDVVLDPFGGSGTTLVVAKKLGRKWIGYELSPNYAAQTQARLDAAAEGQPLAGAEDPKVSAPATAFGKRRGER